MCFLLNAQIYFSVKLSKNEGNVNALLNKKVYFFSLKKKDVVKVHFI